MKRIKKHFCVLLTMLLILCNTTQAFASTYPPLIAISEDTYVIDFSNMDEQGIKEFILSLGISEEECNAALSYLETTLAQSSNTYSLPSNPQEGDTYVENVTLPISLFSALGVFEGTASIKDVIAAIAGTGTVSPIAVAALAATIISLGSQLAGYTSISFEIHYRYGINNDGVMGWNIGPVYTTLNK